MSDREEELVLCVQSKSVEAEDVAVFRLVAVDGRDLPGFEAGAHIEVQAGAAGKRHYSLCNPCARPRYYEIAVLKESASRGGSRYMHEALVEGTEVLASVPRNHFPLEREGSALLLAGGIGITPLFAMVQQLAGEDRDFELHYCARSRSRAAFQTRLASAPYGGRVHFYFDDDPDIGKLDLRTVIGSATPSHHLYVCGPAGFIQKVLDTAAIAGWGSERLHREFFAAPNTPPTQDADREFELVLARSGRTLAVPASKSALAVLQSAGVDVMSSCEAGVCGTCLTRVLEGTPDHRDAYLTNDERERNDSFMPCCSRARTKRLVVDL